MSRPPPFKIFSGSPDAKADIVLVGGIHHNGDASTWPHEVASSIGASARVISFNYSPKVRHFYPDPESQSSRTTVDTHSKALLEALAAARDHNHSNRPIIFAAHDLGGLVCANALIKEDEGARGIAQNTYGLIFCDTPFEGRSSVGWGRVGAKFSALQKSHTSSEGFGARSRTLISINTAFDQLLESHQPSLRVECFCEDNATIQLFDINPRNIAEYDKETLANMLMHWIEECGADGQRTRSKEKLPTVYLGETTYNGPISRNQGVVMGNAYGTTKDANRIIGTQRTFYSYGKDPSSRHRRRDEPSWGTED
ncbi:hypothetical protein TWF696_004134 [Orbilia brochopaga]|uniref:AB hydrolase-1 domain-containing protein n=1 Tax=Orbilia brochopaga TaxID=3140254 RepID=A0AAV9V7V2_9PEZI